MNPASSSFKPPQQMSLCIAAAFLCLHGYADAFGQDVSPRIENAAIAVSLDSADLTLSVTDKRIGHRWQQRTRTGGQFTNIRHGQDLEVTWHDAGAGLDIRMTVELDSDKPEFVLTLSAQGDLKRPLRYPHPFVAEPGMYLVVPMNEGISYPVEDTTVDTFRLIAYGGHGICMPFWGATDGGRAYMAILETPDDAAIQIARLDGRLCVAPEWESQKGRFAYARKLRYVFFDAGGHVAMCKRYRAYAQEAGLLKTLEQKKRENPHVDLLVGAVNVWYWEKDALEMVRDLRAAGIERILWSRRQDPATIRAMNAMPAC
jgi:hypothetical protein